MGGYHGAASSPPGFADSPSTGPVPEGVDNVPLDLQVLKEKEGENRNGRARETLSENE